jgi:hypothetical protein
MTKGSVVVARGIVRAGFGHNPETGYRFVEMRILP